MSDKPELHLGQPVNACRPPQAHQKILGVIISSMAQSDTANPIGLRPLRHQRIPSVPRCGGKVACLNRSLPCQNIMRHSKRFAQLCNPVRLIAALVAQLVIDGYSGNRVTRLGGPTRKQVEQSDAITAARHCNPDAIGKVVGKRRINNMQQHGILALLHEPVLV